jgi:hypothetical protein
MTPELLSALSHERSSLPDALGSELLDREVGDLMTPGYLAISEVPEGVITDFDFAALASV